MHPALKLIDDPLPAFSSAREFTAAMTALASGVVVVTCWVGDRPWGMTVTAFASVSLDPPTVLISLRSDGTSARAITANGRFGVSILAAEQLGVARYGSAPGTTKFLERFSEHAPIDASPLVAGALADLDCDVSEALQVADHTIFFGWVRAVRTSRVGTPLLYHDREYRTLVERAPTEHDTARSARCLSN
jgi:flavin reductase (DIM6/NTAB) family NADH-FMN oxidoreductase RutF